MKISKGFIRILAIILALLMAGSILVGVLGSVGASATVSESAINALKNKQAKLKQDKQSVQARIDSLESQATTALAKKSVLDEQMLLTEAEIDNITMQIAEYINLISEKEAEVAAAQEQEESRYELYKERIRKMEENGTISYCSIAFGASDWADLLARVDYIQEIMSYDESVYDELVAARQATEQAKAGLERAKTESEDTKEELTAKQAELAEQVAEADKYVEELEASLSSYEQLRSEQESEEKALLKEIEDMAAELERLKSVKGTGSFVWPSASSRKVTSEFGSRKHPVYGTYRYHYGIDIGASYGTSILAADSGTVLTATYNSSYGNYVVITHGNGYRTLYAHMSKIYASKGDSVRQGDVVGLVGSTGVSTGPHIHFEIIKDGAKVNPLDFFSNYTIA